MLDKWNKEWHVRVTKSSQQQLQVYVVVGCFWDSSRADSAKRDESLKENIDKE